MSALDLLSPILRTAARVLIVRRDDLPGNDDRLVQHLEAAGAAVTLETQPGYSAMMRDAQESVAPIAALDVMVAWLRQSPGPSLRSVPQGRIHARVLRASSRAGCAIQEQAFQFGEPRCLFGILAEPDDRAALDGHPAILLLNVGANHRVGPNRMYVSIARDLAAIGYRVLRFDVAGLGDSPQPAGTPENRLYSKDSVGDVKAAMDFLGAVRDARRFVLMGLCSGAYLAFHTTVEDARVVGQVLLNPQTFEWKEGDSLELSTRKSFLSTRYYASALRDPLVWSRMLRGRVNVQGIAAMLRERLAARMRLRAEWLGAKVRGSPVPQTDVERAFVQMCDRGVESLLVFSFNDGGLDMIEKHLGRNLRKLSPRTNVHFAIVRDADHTFTPIHSQVQLYNLVTQYVIEAFP